jgi:hypothetical protein
LAWQALFGSFSKKLRETPKLMRISLLPTGYQAEHVRHQANEFLVNQAVTTAFGLMVCLLTGHYKWTSPWLLGSLAGFLALILSAWSTVWTLGVKQAKMAVVGALLLTIGRWALVGGLLLGGGWHSPQQVGVALLACFGYNYAMPVRWVWLRLRYARSTPRPPHDGLH